MTEASVDGQESGGNPEAVTALLAKSTASWSERVSAASAMAHLATRPEVFTRLIEMLGDEDEAVMISAAKALLASDAQAGTAAVLGKLASPGPDTGLADAIAGAIWEAARDPYVFDRLANAADDERLHPSVRATAASVVEELTRMGLPLAADVRAYLARNAGEDRRR